METMVTRLWWTHSNFWHLVVFLLRPNTSPNHWPYFLLLLALLYGSYTHCRLQHTAFLLLHSPTLHSNRSQHTDVTKIPQINFSFTAIVLGTVPSIILIVHRDIFWCNGNRRWITFDKLEFLVHWTYYGSLYRHRKWGREGNGGTAPHYNRLLGL